MFTRLNWKVRCARSRNRADGHRGESPVHEERLQLIGAGGLLAVIRLAMSTISGAMASLTMTRLLKAIACALWSMMSRANKTSNRVWFFGGGNRGG